jgi:aconitate hydratase
MASSFAAERTLEVNGKKYKYFSMSELDAKKLPYSLKILLENMLRTEDGANVTADHVKALVNWNPAAEPDTEIQFTPARVIMQASRVFHV